MDNLSEKTLENIGFSLARLQRMIGGLAALLRCANEDEDTLEQEELQGISEILEILQKESLKASRSLLDKYYTEDLREFACSEDLKKMEEELQRIV